MLKKLFKPALFLVILIGVIYLVGGGFGQETPANNDNDNGKEEFSLKQRNFLILGIDSHDEFKGRTDTIMVAGFNPDRDEINLLSIPRDTRVQIRGGYDKINAAHAYGGPELARETVEDFLDIRIDHHVVINFSAFKEIINLVGGIEVDVPVRMYKPSEGIDLQPGLQLLDGEEALAYVRFRGTPEGDFGRIERQQQVVELLLDRLLSPRMILKLPEISRIIEEHVETDFRLSQVRDISSIANQVRKKPFNTHVLPGHGRTINVGGTDVWFYIPQEEKKPELADRFR